MDAKLYPLEISKMVAGILYVIENSGQEFLDKHSIFKVIYLADKMRLAETGVTVFPSHHVKMTYGPVNSLAKDLLDLEIRKGESSLFRYEGLPVGRVFLTTNATGDENFNVKALVPASKKFFTRKDVDYLDRAITEIRAIGFGKNSFSQRTDHSHDEAWHQAEMNQRIQNREIMKAGGASLEFVTAFVEHEASLEHFK